jgi:hypothetical protein
MNPSKRLLVGRRSRAARGGEAYIAAYTFPAHIESRVRRRVPELDDYGWRLVEQGLREWFVCCAWRGRTLLGMPSYLVDEAWHEFILDSLTYTRFCQAAFGEYLHHTPDEATATRISDALGDTVRAWDRSRMGVSEESVLWDLDRRLGAAESLSLSELQLITARSRSPYPLATGWACVAGVGAGDGSGGGHHYGGYGGDCAAAGGGEAGGGCSGGGCGGGGS